jgi:hypothetical protein
VNRSQQTGGMGCDWDAMGTLYRTKLHPRSR